MNFETLIHASRRRPLVTLFVILAIGIPIAAFATDLFTDVPTAASFHGAVNAIARAGVTTGCATGLYCPNNNVTRAQMALFMHRGFGRLGKSDFNTTLDSGTPSRVDIGPITLSPGIPPDALAGAAAFVSADASLNILVVSSAGCPCTVQARFYDATELQYLQTYPSIVSVPAGSDGMYFHLSPTGTAKVTSSSPHVYSLQALRTVTTAGGSFTIFGDAKVEYFPFGNSGTNTFGAETSAGTE